jgi:PPP family 3-phenylpropionic acid transporter
LWGLAYALYTFAVRPQGTLQDGMYFGEAEQLKAKGQTPPPYSSVRIFGSIGYLLPLLILGGCAAWLVAQGRHLPAAIPMLAGVGVAVIAVLNTLTLPPSELPARQGKGLPTLEAVGQLSKHKAWPFVLGMLLLHAGTVSYFSHQPRLLTETYGLPQDFVSWVPALDVVLELVPMLFAPWMIERFGARRVLLFAVFAQAARYGVFALAPALVPAWSQWLGVDAASFAGRAPLWAAILAKGLFHGPIIVGIYVVPPILLNRMATPSCRSSVQAFYTMLAVGIGVLGGNLVLGHVAAVLGYPAVFLVAGAMIAAGGVILAASAWGYEPPLAPAQEEESQAPSAGSSAETDV